VTQGLLRRPFFFGAKQVTQLDTAVADAPVLDDANGATADQTNAPIDPASMYPEDAREPQDPGDEPEQTDDQPVDEDPIDDVDEPEAAIDPPVSWDKEAKAKFAQLPPDMQAFLAEQDAHRNRQVTDVTTRAAEAQRQAQAELQANVAESQQYYAQQVELVAKQFLPPEPNPAQYSDMGAYQRDRYAYDQAVAQHRQLMQHVQDVRAQSEQQLSQQQQQMIIQDAKRVSIELPELNDQTQYTQLVQDLTPIAKELGYDDERIAQAWPSDILAMKRVKGWKDKASKWDSLQARKMEGVRSAKSLPKVSAPGAAGTAARAAPVPIAKQLYPND
jgi:hypothetical protein